MAKAFSAGFHREAHRALPLPVGSSARVARYRHFGRRRRIRPLSSPATSVAAGSAFMTVVRPHQAESLGPRDAPAQFGNARRHWEMWLLRRRKTRRNTVNTFFERRAGSNNRGTLEHTVDLIHGGLPVTRQETPGFPQVREMMFVITESNSRSPFSIAGGASPIYCQATPLSGAPPVIPERRIRDSNQRP